LQGGDFFAGRAFEVHREPQDWNKYASDPGGNILASGSSMEPARGAIVAAELLNSSSFIENTGKFPGCS
jgi:hypothetical protein